MTNDKKIMTNDIKGKATPVAFPFYSLKTPNILSKHKASCQESKHPIKTQSILSNPSHPIKTLSLQTGVLESAIKLQSSLAQCLGLTYIYKV